MSIFNIIDFGAEGNGKRNATAALQKAIDVCALSGGGCVYVPQGTYSTGMLTLKSHINLHLEAGAVIKGSDDADAYPVLGPTPFNNAPGQIQVLLYACDAEDIVVSGQGVIDGGGYADLWGPDSHKETFRPALVLFKDCLRVKFQDVNLAYSRYWTLHLQRCRDVEIRGVSINANQNRINTDGIDPDGCTNVQISDCNITTGDDCIVLKSTQGDVCENITVSNCILSSKCAAFKIGTETIGPIRNVTVHNCIVRESSHGLMVYSKDGGEIENCIVADCVFDVREHFPLMLDITPRFHHESTPGPVRAFQFNNLIFAGPGRALLQGTDACALDDISLKSIVWNVKGESADFTACTKPLGSARSEPDPRAPNLTTRQAQFIVSHVNGLTLDDIIVRARNEDQMLDRGVFYLDNITKGMVKHFRCDKLRESINPVAMHQCRNVKL
ncbi:MAG: hypothetical protein GF398_16585 [Chitinivibrionales bacterium]|nr:hypothetical protein [Chitinivibrionales bacterium]